MGLLTNRTLRSMIVFPLFLLYLAVGGTACAHRAAVGATAAAPLTAGQSAAAKAFLKQQASSSMTRQVLNAVDLGEGDSELRRLRDLVTANPGDLPSRLALAKHYTSQGFPEIALEHLRLACERAPESVEAHLELARALRREGQPEEGVKLLAKFALKPATDVEVLAWLGLLQDESGNWKAGETAHRQAIDLAPKRDDLHNNLGYCLLEQGRNEEAAVEFRAALHLNKNSLIARDNLGVALAATPKEAVLHWQSVSDPASAHSNMAAVLIEAGNYAGARKEIDVALSYNRQHPAALSNLRLLSQLDGKPVEYHKEKPQSRWTRFRAVVSHLTTARFWNDRSVEDLSTKDTGKAVASR